MYPQIELQNQIKLTQAGEALTKRVLTGTATSTITQLFGCGHWIQRQNGDSLFATCPKCFINRPLT